MGDIVGAHSTYQILSGELAPGLVEAIIKHENMEKRQGNIKGAMSVYEMTIDIEKGKEESCALPLLFIQYSRFLDQIVEVYEQVVQVVTYSMYIWMHYYTVAMSEFEDPEDTRRLFERGLSYVREDYSSCGLMENCNIDVATDLKKIKEDEEPLIDAVEDEVIKAKENAFGPSRETSDNIVDDVYKEPIKQE
eukprot:Gb_36854 [translate_table: standard]